MGGDLKSFALKQRVFLVKNYYQYMGDYLCVKTKYEDHYKDSLECPAFSYDILMEIINMFERTGSVIKTESFGETTIQSRPIESVFLREEDPVSTVGVKVEDQKKQVIFEVIDANDMLWESTAEEYSDLESDDEKQKSAKSSQLEPLHKRVCHPCERVFRKIEELEKHNSAVHRQKATTKPTPAKRKCPASSQQDVATVMLHPLYDNKFSDILRKLDRLLCIQKRQSASSSPSTPWTSTALYTSIEDEMDLRFPIMTKEQLATYNSRLADASYKQSFIQELSKVCGVSGTADGTKVAYRLSEHMFDRALLTQFTWTGKNMNNKLSTSGKEAFSQYTHFVDTYAEIVRLADNQYSNMDNEKFFKVKLLKYAGFRLKQKPR
ncbi:uncharacterized protein LOC132256070 [Phlebotomus argentipes]|uniref:uncharacterized protein LOC132256070 n=1 Tax=Phlebotomus argentipes TaxID=94469 RepID=UPI002892E75D|nr:uncharacterized protein LOC132256070 [Phlebotomus argentipes]